MHIAPDSITRNDSGFFRYDVVEGDVFVENRGAPIAVIEEYMKQHRKGLIVALSAHEQLSEQMRPVRMAPVIAFNPEAKPASDHWHEGLGETFPHEHAGYDTDLAELGDAVALLRTARKAQEEIDLEYGERLSRAESLLRLIDSTALRNLPEHGHAAQATRLSAIEGAIDILKGMLDSAASRFADTNHPHDGLTAMMREMAEKQKAMAKELEAAKADASVLLERLAAAEKLLAATPEGVATEKSLSALESRLLTEIEKRPIIKAEFVAEQISAEEVAGKSRFVVKQL